MEAIRFSGTFNGMDNLIFQDGYPSYVAKSNINLSTKPFTWQGKNYTGYFDAVTDVMADDDPAHNIAALTQDLAKAIAADLAQTTYTTLNTAMTTHYDRAAMDSSDPYSVYIYDYRDDDAIKLTSAGASVDSSIRTSSRVSFQYDETITTGYYTYYADGLSILDKRLSAETLGLSDYRVDTYFSEVTMEDPEEFRKKFAEWEAAAPKPEIVYETKRVQTTTLKKSAVYKYEYVNGEKKSVLVSRAEYETKWEDRQVGRVGQRYYYHFPL